ncbi:MAG: glycoside hydrolase family 3 protein [Micromonosporaceae bacterium]
MPSATRRQLLAGAGLTAAAVAAGSAITGTAASAAPRSSGAGWVNRTMRRMTLEEKVGQLFVLIAYGENATDPAAGDREFNRDLYGVETPEEIIEKHAPGGIIYFSWTHSLNTPRQVAELSNGIQRSSLRRPTEAPVPLLIAIDQEHGVVLRLGPPVTMFPGAMGLGAGRDVDAAYQSAKITGKELRALGITQNYAPVADVNVNPLNPVIGVRSIGSDPALVAELTAAQVRGFQGGAGVMATTKHFPGHGDTATDSHTGLPEIDHTREEWEQIDAPPFQAAIAAGVDMIMTAHIVVPSLDPAKDPATLSRPIMTGILREQLGYTGVVVTDSLGMAGVRTKYGDDRVPVLALQAGVDMLLMPPNPAVAFGGVMSALRSGELTEERIDQSLRRVLELKWARGLVEESHVNPDKIPDRVGTPEHLAAAQQFADHAITAVKNDAGLLPLNPTGKSILVTGYDSSTFDSTGVLSDALTSQGADVTAQRYGTRPTDTQIAAAVAAANQNDLTVVLTHKAWDTKITDPAGKQQKLVHDLIATGKPVVVVASRDPYDIAYFTEASTYLVSYAYNAPVMTALAKVLVGELSPTGKLPVSIPTAADPDTELYPYGHGLSW